MTFAADHATVMITLSATEAGGVRIDGWVAPAGRFRSRCTAWTGPSRPDRRRRLVRARRHRTRSGEPRAAAARPRVAGDEHARHRPVTPTQAQQTPAQQTQAQQ